MKIEEAILYCLASQNRGMRTEQIAEMINRQRLHIRKDGQPVIQSGLCGDLSLSRHFHKGRRTDYVDDINVIKL